MQKIIQEFDADISGFEKKAEKMIAVIDSISKKSKKISIEIVGANKLEKDLSGINKSLDGIKKVNFSTLERRVETLTSKLKPLNSELKETAKYFKSIAKDSKNSSDNFRSFISEVGNLNERINKLNKNFDELNKNQNSSAKASEHWNNKLNVGNGFIGSMTNSVQRLLPFLSALFVVNSVISFGQALFEVNRQFELFELKANSALYGSKLAVEEYYAALQRIDIKSLFDIGELEDGLVKLLNRRILLTEDQLQSLADTAESVGTKGAQSFNQIVDALLDATVGQFKRLEELGVGVDATGSKLRLTFAGTTTEIDKGTEAIKQYILGMNKMNGAVDLSARTANTLEGKLSSLKTQFDNLIKKVGEMGATSAFATILDEASNFLSLIDKIIKKWSDMEGTIFSGTDLKYGLRGAATGALAGSVLPGVGTAAGAIIGAAGGFIYSDASSGKKDPLKVETFMKMGGEYEKAVKKIISINDELYQRGRSRNELNNTFFFNPSNFSTESLKNYATELQVIINKAKELGVGNDKGAYGQQYKTSIQRLSSIQNELLARNGGTNDDDKAKRERDRLIRLEESKKDLQDSINKNRIKALNDLVEQEKRIEIEGLKERIRFTVENSNEYLRLKQLIGEKEIELERKTAREATRERLIKASEYLYINKAGKADRGFVIPSESKIDETFKQENDIFNMRLLFLQKSTNNAINENSSKLRDTQKSIFDKISEFIESSQDREKRAVVAKYNAIQNEIDKLRKTGLSPLNEAIVSGVEIQIKSLEKLELQLISLRNAQEGSVQNSRSSVKKMPNETNYSYNRRVEIAGLQQVADNKSEELAFLDFYKNQNPNIANDPTFKLIVENAKKAVEQAYSDLGESINKQNIEVGFNDGLIAKVFGLNKDSTTFNKDLEGLKASFNQIVDVYYDFINSLISLEKKKEDEADKNLQNLRERLSKEEELKKNGLANNYNAIQNDIKRQEQLKEEAAKKQMQLQKLQIASNAIMKESEMALLVIQILTGASKYGPVAGPIIAGVTLAAMLGLAATTISQFKSLKAEEGGILVGSRHYNGGINVNAEDGEGFIRRPSSIPNRQLVMNLNNIKKKVTYDNLHELLAGTGIALPSQDNEWRSHVDSYNSLHMKHIIDNSRLEARLENLENVMSSVAKNTSRIPEKQYVPLKDGKVLVIDGDNTKILNS